MEERDRGLWTGWSLEIAWEEAIEMEERDRRSGSGWTGCGRAGAAEIARSEIEGQDPVDELWSGSCRNSMGGGLGRMGCSGRSFM